MADEAPATGAEVDPLSGAASGWEAPKFPCLAPDRICRFKISKATKAPTKDNPDRESLTLVLKTEKDYTDTEGKPLRAGFTGYKRIGVTPVAEEADKRPRTWKNIGEDLGMVLKATGMLDKSPRDLLNNPAIVEGQVVDCKVGLQKEKDGFPQSNTFSFVLPA
jgi:hypothetical protein